LKPRAGLVAALLLGLALPSLGAAPPRWFRGNTHTHTLWSDGDGAPDEVVDWYVSHGYDFLVLSDHNVIAEGEKWIPIGAEKKSISPARVEALRAKYGERVVTREREGRAEMRLRTLDEVRRDFERPGTFLMIRGEEITDWSTNVHHGLLNAPRTVAPASAGSARDALEKTVALAQAEEKRCGCPLLLHLNHPNYLWAVTPDDLAHVLGERYFEVYNGHRFAHNEGDAAHASTEKVWDLVNTARLTELGGDPLFGLATDDMHELHDFPSVTNPGRGWIVLRAPALTMPAILAAMKAGDFYASSGVALDDVVRGRHALTVKIAAQAGVTYTTRFYGTRVKDGERGAIGELLAEVEGSEATYRFKGDELYVRATVVSSRLHPNPYAKGDLETAWVQPVVVKRVAPKAQ
jgi:hypothetical protein